MDILGNKGLLSLFIFPYPEKLIIKDENLMDKKKNISLPKWLPKMWKLHLTPPVPASLPIIHTGNLNCASQPLFASRHRKPLPTSQLTAHPLQPHHPCLLPKGDPSPLSQRSFPCLYSLTEGLWLPPFPPTRATHTLLLTNILNLKEL